MPDGAAHGVSPPFFFTCRRPTRRRDAHRPNILSKVYTEAGFGLAIGKNKGGVQVIWVQVFGRPKVRFG